MPINSRLSLLLLTALFASSPVQAEDYDELDERLQAVEERLAGSNGQGSGGMLGMVNDFQRLQEEVRSLRGEVERLQFEAEQNRNRQREMFLDIEKRLSSLEKGGKAVVTPPSLPVTSDAPISMPGTEAPAVSAPPEPGIKPPAEVDVDEAEQAALPAVVAPPPPSISEQEAYLQAFELLKQGRYDDSITAFTAFLVQFPDGNYADNARYWLAETHYVKKNYKTALAQFQLLLSEHPDSSKLPGALLKIGYIQYELNNNLEARAALERVRIEFSDSSVADLAKQRLERMDREGR